MDVNTWLMAAQRDAEARHLPELKPLLETLAASTAVLRDAHDRLRERDVHPPRPR